MRRGDRGAAELTTRIPVVAIGAGQVDLPLAALEQCLPARQGGAQPLVGRRRDRQAARLAGDEGEHAPALRPFRWQRRRALMVNAAALDPPLERARPAGLRVEDEIAGGHAAHARNGIAMAVGAGASGTLGVLAPARRAVEQPRACRDCANRRRA